jgi:hypothetical protein
MKHCRDSVKRLLRKGDDSRIKMTLFLRAE